MTCSKCGSPGVIRVPGNVGFYGSGNNIATGLAIWQRVKAARYVCASCGFVEEWVDSPSELEKLKEKYGGAG
jgi:hypothetical protein